jgi:hypothetical protein
MTEQNPAPVVTANAAGQSPSGDGSLPQESSTAGVGCSEPESFLEWQLRKSIAIQAGASNERRTQPSLEGSDNSELHPSDTGDKGSE